MFKSIPVGTLLQRTGAWVQSRAWNDQRFNDLTGRTLLVYYSDFVGVLGIVVGAGLSADENLGEKHEIPSRFLGGETYFRVLPHPAEGAYDCRGAQLDTNIYLLTAHIPVSVTPPAALREAALARARRHIFRYATGDWSQSNIACGACATHYVRIERQYAAEAETQAAR